jgi:hypothetical protein
MVIFDLLFGLLLVFAGRNLFWLCVGIIGFLIGAQCAGFFGFSNGWMALLFAAAFGSVGVVLAVSFEWFMVIFGVGFLGGGYLLMDIFPSSNQQDSYAWLIFVVGGIVGMCLMVITFDLTLILISSLLGATLIAGAIDGSQQLRELSFVSSMMTGMVVQYLILRDSPSQKHWQRGHHAH